MGAGTAAYKGIVAAKKTFSAWKAQLCAGNFSFIGEKLEFHTLETLVPNARNYLKLLLI